MKYTDYGFDSEEEYLESLKKDDSYHYSVPFEYIKKNYGNGSYDTETAYMEVDVVWDETEHGYVKSYYCNQENQIDPNQGNGDLADFYENDVDWKVDDLLGCEGITTAAICTFSYRK